METLRKHIKANSFCNFYLLYGDDDYRVSHAGRMLVDALKGDGGEMNFAHFEGAQESFDEFLENARTLPFFADRRVILCEDTGLFKGSKKKRDENAPQGPQDEDDATSSRAAYLIENLDSICDTTFIVFVEKSVDKRTKIYKYVNDHGYVCELSKLGFDRLKDQVAAYLDRFGKKISVNDCSYLIETCGDDMYGLINELDKLIGYTGDRTAVTRKDIDSVCTASVQNKIFEMTDAIANHNRELALSRYYDLVKLREKPMAILALIRKHFVKLLGIMEERNERRSDAEIAKSIGVPDWALRKNYYPQLKAYDYDTLLRCVEFATDVETDFKSGKISEQIGVELMIVKFTAM